MDSALNKKNQSISSTLSTGERIFQEEVDKVEEYYEQFYEIINEHKRRVLD